MFKTAAGLVVSLVLAASAAFAQPAASAANASGHWEGTIEIPEHPMPMSVDLAKDAKGTWIGSMSVGATTSVDVPLRSVEINGEAVRFRARLPEEASFEGRIAADGSFAGSATNPQGSAPFKLTRGGEANVKLPAPSTALPKQFAGDWQGAIDVQGKQLRIEMKLAAGSDGLATATLVSLDQGNVELPVDTVAIHDGRLQIESRAVSGKYAGTLGGNGEIAGMWSQGPKSLPLNFKRVDTAKP